MYEYFMDYVTTFFVSLGLEYLGYPEYVCKHSLRTQAIIFCEEIKKHSVGGHHVQHLTVAKKLWDFVRPFTGHQSFLN